MLYLYDELGPDFVKLLNGIFAFVIYDPRDGSFFIARDHIGINPLYWGRDGEGNLFVSSEMKALYDVCRKVEVFPPGHYYHRARAARAVVQARSGRPKASVPQGRGRPRRCSGSPSRTR